MRVSIRLLPGLLAVFFIIHGCRHQGKDIDIPNVQEIYSDIAFLDSLIQSNSVDSIELSGIQLNNTLQVYKNHAQSPDDKAILDSLEKCYSRIHELIRFCTDTQLNLELLVQDVRSVEMQYKSGKIQLDAYISALMESEQILVELNNKFSDSYTQASRGSRFQSSLVNLLSPLPVQGP